MGVIARRAAGLACALCVALAPLAPLAAAGAAAEPYAPKPFAEMLLQGVAYDPAVPTPQSVTGYALGDMVLPYELLAAYARAVDAATDRVSIEVIGRSHLGRPILAVTVTSAANQARLPAIRAAQQAQLAAGAGPPPPDQPLVIEIVHGVHGAETSSYDVAPLLLYHLAAAEDAATRALREHAVVTLIITLNPDGGARMATWINAHHADVPVEHPRHRERGPFFLWGRGNHYWFDLNRQWLPVVEPEAAAVVGWTQDWLPHVVADLHEMDEESSYFVSPGPRAGLNPLLTQESFEIARAITADVAAEADAEGRLYVSEEDYDDYYLGYGSSYPGLLGAVTFLFEQSATRGLVYAGADGLQRYDDKIEETFRSVLAMLDGALARRDAFLNYRGRYFADERAAADADPVKAYVFASDDRARLRGFLAMLATHRVDVRTLARDVQVEGTEFRAGDAYLVPAAQARYAVVRGLFETRIPEDQSDFYDITGWTMPLAYGLETGELRGRGLDASLLGAPAGPETPPPVAAPPESPYAYVLEWRSRFAPRTLYRLLSAGVHARVLPEPARVRVADGYVEAPRGSIVVPVADQPLDASALHALMVRAAREDDVAVHAAVSGLTPTGPDLGSFDLEPLQQPRVMLVTGLGVSDEEAGEVWRLLDHEMAIPVVMIDQSALDGAVLYDFTHVILVDGVYDRLPAGFAGALDGWVRAGGVLVASRGGAGWAAGSGLAGARTLDRPGKAGLAGPAADGSWPDRTAYADRRRAEAESSIGGAVFALRLDPTHPIAYGYESEHSFEHRAGESAFTTSPERSVNAVAWYPPDALVSGYASEENQQRLAGATSVYAERRGQGAAVLFADDPLFRGYWLESEKMFLNALFFARSIAPADTSSYR